MSKVTQLTDPVTNEKTYPVTFTDCVYLPDGTSLTSFLNRIPLPVGSIVVSTSVQNNAGLHLADGSELAIGGTYDAFCQYVINHQDRFTITDLSTYEAELITYGQCGKYVITDTYVRIPTITKYVEGLSSLSDLGTSFGAGLPNITGSVTANRGLSRDNMSSVGALTASGSAEMATSNANYTSHNTIAIDASKSNGIYGNSDTVQPQATKYPYYIVVGTVSKTDIEVNLDNIATDLNNKADKTGANIDKDAFKVALNLEPTLLWENPNQGSTLSAQTIVVPDMTEFKKIIVYLRTYLNYGAPQKFEFERLDFGTQPYLCGNVENGATFNRAIQLRTSTSIYIAGGYKGTSTNNGQAIISAIYGLK